MRTVELAILLCLAFATPSLAREPAASTRPLITPDWIRTPTADDADKVHPPLAKILFLEGRASIECLVAKQGLLTDCKVVDETPTDIGFGAAALALADRFQLNDPMNVATVDGESAESPVGRKVTIPLVFRPARKPRQGGPPPIAPEAPEARRALAARVAEAEGEYHQLHITLEGQSGLFDLPFKDAPPALSEVSASYKRALMALEPETRWQIADLYAATYSDEELRQRLLKPQRSDIRVLGGGVNQIWMRATFVALLAASAEFCAKRVCLSPSPIAAPSSPPPPAPR